MFFAKLCCVILLVIHHGGGMKIYFNMTGDVPLKSKQLHKQLLKVVNRDCLMCQYETKLSDAEVSDGFYNIVGRNNMTVSEQVGCFMFCFLKTFGLVFDNHVVDMIMLKSATEIYQTTMRPYPRFRAIMSVMIACYVKMKYPERLPHCELLTTILKCVALYEKQYGPYTVRLL